MAGSRNSKCAGTRSSTRSTAGKPKKRIARKTRSRTGAKRRSPGKHSKKTKRTATSKKNGQDKVVISRPVRIAICGVFFEKYHYSYIHVSTCDGFDCLPSKAHIDAMLHWIAKVFYDSKKGIFERTTKTEYDSLVKKGFTFDRRKAKLNRFILEMNRLRHIPQKGQPMYEEARYYRGKKNEPDVFKELDSRVWWKWSRIDRLTKKKTTKTATAEAKEDGLELNMDDAMNSSSLEADGGSQSSALINGPRSGEQTTLEAAHNVAST